MVPVVSKFEVAEVVLVMVVVLVAPTVIAAPMLTVRARAEEAVGLILKLPSIVIASLPKV